MESSRSPRPAFAHASEAEMARILDFYDVRWEYEPHLFPILWNLDGDVVESFAPDFWLPDLDLFLEMTTLKQRLVRKKNRKLRRLRELYPGIRIKLFYARDFRALMLKYGRLALVDDMSGTSGQVVPGPLGASGSDEVPTPARTDGPASRPDPAAARRPASGGRPAAPGPVAVGAGRRPTRRRRRPVDDASVRPVHASVADPIPASREAER